MSTSSMSPPPEPGAVRLSGRAWGVLFVLCGAIFLEGIDAAMLNVALPSIRADLGMSTGELQWVMSAYVVGYGGFMLLGGRAADLFGRRQMFLFWLTVFLLFSGLGERHRATDDDVPRAVPAAAEGEETAGAAR